MNPRIDTAPEVVGEMIARDTQPSIPRNIARATHSLAFERRAEMQAYRHNLIYKSDELKPESPLDEIDVEDFQTAHQMTKLVNRLERRTNVFRARQRKMDGLQKRVYQKTQKSTEVINGDRRQFTEQREKMLRGMNLFISDTDKLIAQKDYYLETLAKALDTLSNIPAADTESNEIEEEHALIAYKILMSKAKLPPRYTPKYANGMSIMELITQINAESADIYVQLAEYKIEIALEESILSKLEDKMLEMEEMYTNHDAVGFNQLCLDLVGSESVRLFRDGSISGEVINKIKTRLVSKMFRLYFVEEIKGVPSSKYGTPKDQEGGETILDGTPAPNTGSEAPAVFSSPFNELELK